MRPPLSPSQCQQSLDFCPHLVVKSHHSFSLLGSVREGLVENQDFHLLPEIMRPPHTLMSFEAAWRAVTRYPWRPSWKPSIWPQHSSNKEPPLTLVSMGPKGKPGFLSSFDNKETSLCVKPEQSFLLRKRKPKLV